MEPDVYVVARHEEDGLIFELVVMKDDAQAVQQGATPVFWAQGRVRISSAVQDVTDEGPIQTENLAER